MSINISDLLGTVPTGLLIGGEWRASSTGRTFTVENPATGETLATIAAGSSDDAVAALDAADAVQGKWARTAPRERAEILRRAFDLVIDRSEEFATLMTLEMGKPLAEARGEVQYGAEFLRWFSEETARQYGRFFEAPEGTLRMLTTRKPVGPCLLITPWNFPLAMATRKVAPAIAAGCTMVLKPAELTPLTAHYFAQTMIDAGLPPGVLNLVSSDQAAEISAPLIADPRLRKVSFTGSTAVGKILMKQCADNVVRTSMELGGNAPFLVFEDADLDAAVDGAIAAKTRNMGEACTAANRILVHESVAEEFGRRLAERMGALTVGDGLDQDTDIGPLIAAKAVTAMQDLVTDAIAGNAQVLTGGEKIPGDGHFFAPTVLTDLAPDCRLLTEEIFGPIAPITTFSTEEEALEKANSTEYGLASYVFTSDMSRIFRLSGGLEFGLMGVNTGIISNAAAPFGGVKQSGLGREGGAEGINDYTTVQYIGIADPYAENT
jgi:succinate-semialdehyde dehydrogenase/glutarate-semialdehyde dehydrogenase